jgi:hypothetical protein
MVYLETNDVELGRQALIHFDHRGICNFASVTPLSEYAISNKSYCDHILVAATPVELIPREAGIGMRSQQPYPLTTLIRGQQ